MMGRSLTGGLSAALFLSTALVAPACADVFTTTNIPFLSGYPAGEDAYTISAQPVGGLIRVFGEAFSNSSQTGFSYLSNGALSSIGDQSGNAPSPIAITILGSAAWLTFTDAATGEQVGYFDSGVFKGDGFYGTAGNYLLLTAADLPASDAVNALHNGITLTGADDHGDLIGYVPGNADVSFLALDTSTAGNWAPPANDPPPTDVPEPGTLAILGTALVALGLLLRRRKEGVAGAAA